VTSISKQPLRKRLLFLTGEDAAYVACKSRCREFD